MIFESDIQLQIEKVFAIALTLQATDRFDNVCDDLKDILKLNLDQLIYQRNLLNQKECSIDINGTYRKIDFC